MSLRPNKPTSCERCGRLYSSRATCRSHERTCILIPVPEQMAAELMSDPTVSVEYLARQYGVSRDFIRSHLVLAGLPESDIEDRWDNRRSIKLAASVCQRCTIYVFPDRKSLPKRWLWRVNGAVRVGNETMCYGCAKEEGHG